VAVESAPKTPSASGSARPPARGSVLVQVAGEVARPGVYRIANGARVNDAVERAGGLTRRADPAGVNLVARVQDGQQVVVPRRGGGLVSAGSAGAGRGTGAGSGAAAAPGPPISLGSATPEQLDSIDSIGPTLAQRIVEYGRKHGGFRSVDELRQVDGIGQKRFEALRSRLTP
jgi:competence protein ComEA